MLLPSLLAAILPTLAYVTLVYWVDQYEKEPLWLLSAAFVWGAAPAVVMALVLNTVLGLPFYVFGEEAGLVLSAVLVAPLVEEVAKGLAIVGILLFRHYEIDSPLDGIIYGAMVGLGFAMVENFTYFVDQYRLGGLEAWQANIVWRAFVFGLNHALYSSAFGLGLALARFAPQQSARRLLYPVVGLAAAIGLHAFHNLGVSFGPLLCLAWLVDWAGNALFAAIAVWALVQERRWIRAYIPAEVARGTVMPSHFAVARSTRARWAIAGRTLIRHGPRHWRRTSALLHTISELAYKIHHATLFDTPAQAEQIARAREKAIVAAEKVGPW